MHTFLFGLLASLASNQDGSVQRVSGKSIEVEHALIVATTAPEAIHAGSAVLERGGSAVDAALTTALSQITLCAGCWVSFAGRLTAVVYDAESGAVSALNACYDAPREELDPRSIPRQPTPSGRTVLVPGFMAGVGALHERFGKLPFAELFAPAIALAEDGFELTPNLARLIRGKREVLLRTEQGRRVFLDAAGELHAPGDLFRQTDLARTLKRTAEEGVGYFYTGEWAEHCVEVVRAEGGKLSLEDLALYRPLWQQPTVTSFRGTQVHGMPSPNRGGASAVLALNLATSSGLFGKDNPNTSAEGLFRLASIEQALGVLWSKRGRQALVEAVPGIDVLWNTSFADPTPAAQLWKAIESPAWKAIVERTWGTPQRDEHSDAIVTIDRRGNVVAMIHTINTGGWGTTGIFVDGVSIPDSGASQQGSMHSVGPGGRMADHGVPLIGLRGGKPVFASSATGSGNIQASWQNAIQILGFDRTPAEVANGPHLYAGQVQGGDFPREQIERVRELGLSLQTVERHGNYQKGYWVGATIDPDTGRMRAACLRALSGLAVGD